GYLPRAPASGGVSRIVTDPFGGVLDVTELGAFPTEALGRTLELIDGVCVFPTCNRSAVDADKDHKKPHPGGPTTGANLWSLCRRHHRMKTLGVVDTDVGTHGRHRWRMPNGRVVESHAHMA
ncbi:HNH endonuclease signature motif containing protein, partial [Aeromicrobium sp.]|uniref:HNH endonuclease signature motif containing protein n=1 Tax=Aeromicrobium sp. TaxID=1871063 RepID=UPI003D6A92FF